MSSSLPTGKPYSRLDDFPLDDSTLFETLAAAEEYAQNSPIVYHTQIIGVTDEDKVYMIAEDRSLIPLIGGGDGEGGATEEDVTLLGTHLGGLEDGATIPEGTTLTELLKMLTQKRIAPIYEAPVLTLTGLAPFIMEAGSTITSTLSSDFVQNDAGPLTYYELFKNQVSVHNDTITSDYEISGSVIGDETWDFHSTVTFDDGAVKVDNQDEESPDGAIEAGSVDSEIVSYVGKRSTFYDVDEETIAVEDSDAVRNLTETILGQKKGDRWTIGIPVGSRRVTIALPASLGVVASIKYLEQGGCEYKDLFRADVINVEGADGYTAIAYNVYTWITAVPTPAVMTLDVTV